MRSSNANGRTRRSPGDELWPRLGVTRAGTWVHSAATPVAGFSALCRLAGCGKSRDFGETVMKRARNGNPGLIKSTGYEGAKGDESGWKHHRPTFSAAC